MLWWHNQSIFHNKSISKRLLCKWDDGAQGEAEAEQGGGAGEAEAEAGGKESGSEKGHNPIEHRGFVGGYLATYVGDDPDHEQGDDHEQGETTTAGT